MGVKGSERIISTLTSEGGKIFLTANSRILNNQNAPSTAQEIESPMTKIREVP